LFIEQNAIKQAGILAFQLCFTLAQQATALVLEKNTKNIFFPFKFC